MAKEYLLDTNAYFNLLKALHDLPEDGNIPDALSELRNGKLFISRITQVEIISVLGKYARGNNGGMQKCNCVISEDGKRCEHFRYQQQRKPWKARQIKGWLKLIDDTINGQDAYVSVDLVPFSDSTIVEAQKIIMHALKNNFASMDAMIAATAQEARNNSRDMTVVTSDKGLKSCLEKCNIPCLDVFPLAAS